MDHIHPLSGATTFIFSYSFEVKEIALSFSIEESFGEKEAFLVSFYPFEEK